MPKIIIAFTFLIATSLYSCGSGNSDQPQVGTFAAKSYANAFWIEDVLTGAYSQFLETGSLEKFCNSFCSITKDSSGGLIRECNVPAVVHIDGNNNLSYCDWRNDFNNSQCMNLGRIQDSGDVELAVQGLNWIKVRPVSLDTLDIGAENSYGARSIIVNRTGVNRIIEVQNMLSSCGI